MSSNYRKLPGGRYLGLLAAIAFGLFAAPASAVLELVEESVEAVELEVRVDRSLNGYATGAKCESCAKRRFKVTPETVYYRNYKRVDPSQASSFSGKPGTIIYNIKSRDVTKILQVE